VFDYEQHLSNEMLNALEATKQELLILVSNADTIESLEQAYNQVEQTTLLYQPEQGFTFNKQYIHIDSDYVKNAISKHDFAEHELNVMLKYKNQLEVYVIELKAKKTTYQTRIQERLDADAKQKALLEAQRQKLIDEEKARIASSKTAEKNQAEVAKQMQVFESSIKSTASISATTVKQVINVKSEYEVIINDVSAWGQLFTFWFENEGRTWTSDKIANMTLERCKSYAEKRAEKDDVKITSESIEYKTKITAK